MSKDQRRAELLTKLETLRFAAGNPGVNLDPLLTEPCKAALKKIKRLDIQNQIDRAQSELASLN